MVVVVCMPVCTQRPEKDMTSFGVVVTGICKIPSLLPGCQNLNSSPHGCLASSLSHGVTFLAY